MLVIIFGVNVFVTITVAIAFDEMYDIWYYCT